MTYVTLYQKMSKEIKTENICIKNRELINIGREKLASTSSV